MRQKILLSCVLGAVALPGGLAAQEAGHSGFEEIIVTARKREESLQNIPLSITAFDARQIEAAQINDLSDLTQFAPGFDFKNQSFSQGGRWQPSVRFRGLNSGSGNPNFQVGAVFVDGIYVWGSQSSISSFDMERIEVIKGPQNAYFGRNTFSGAVNFITRDPSDEWSARFEAGIEERDTYRIGGSIEGPVIKDILAFRLSAVDAQRGGHFPTSDGGRLGEEKDRTINLTMLLTPTERTRIRARYSRIENDDGPGTTTKLSSFLDPSLPNACTTGTVPFFCGEVPANRNGVDSTTVITVEPLRSQFEAILANDAAAISTFSTRPYDGSSRSLGLIADFGLDGVGLLREADRFSLELGHSFDNGYSVDVLYGRNKNRQVNLNDQTGAPGLGSFLAFSFGALDFEDDSVELRLTSPQDSRLRWLLGYNRVSQEVFGGISGGIGVTISGNSLANFFPPPEGALTTKSRFDGIFAAASFDINDQWTVDLEGRSQTDEVTNAAGSPVEAKQKFDDFAPRFILTWRPTEDLTTYVSWAKGLLPGTTNTNLNLFNAADVAALQADFPGAGETVDSEKLYSLELGLKQRIGPVDFSVALYDMDWENRKNQVFSTCVSGGLGVCLAASGDPAAPRPSGSGQISAVVPQNARIRGLEAEARWLVTDGVGVGGTLSVVNAKNGRFQSRFTAAATGDPDADGKRPIEFPTRSGSLYIDYERPLPGSRAWFTRADILYTGKSYVDDSNQSYLAPWTQINLRTGVLADSWRVEAYVTNLTNKDAWISGRRNTDFSTLFTAGLTQAVAAVPLRKRAVGLRFAYDFDL